MRSWTRADSGFVAVIITAAVLRLALLLTSEAGVDSDEAVTGIMAMHIAEGKSLPLFVYGYSYNGGAAITAYFAASLFAVSGVSNLALKIVPMAFSLAFMAAAYFFCRRFFSPRAGLIASALLLADPGYLQWNLNARGGQVIDLFLSVLLLYVFYRRFFERDQRLKWPFLFGLLAGLGYWNFPSLLPLSIGLCVFVVLRDGWPFVKRELPLVGAGVLLGALPVVLHAAFGTHPGGSSQHFMEVSALRDLPLNLATVLALRFPALFSPWNYFGYVFWYCWILAALTLTWLVSLAVETRRGLKPLLGISGGKHQTERTGRRHMPQRAWLLILYVVGFLALTSFNKAGVAFARYLLPIHAPVTILSAVLLDLWLKSDRIRAGLAAGGLAVFLSLGLGVHVRHLFDEPATNEESVQGDYALPKGVIRIPEEQLRQLLTFLQERNIRCVEAATELATKIVFESRERVLATHVWLTRQHNYYPPYPREIERRKAAGDPRAVVYWANMVFCKISWSNPDYEKWWERYLGSWRWQGGTYKVTRVGSFLVYFDFTTGQQTTRDFSDDGFFTGPPAK